jgi:hypothetical protein
MHHAQKDTKHFTLSIVREKLLELKVLAMGGECFPAQCEIITHHPRKDPHAPYRGIFCRLLGGGGRKYLLP